MGGSALNRLSQRLAECLKASEPAAKLACVHALQADCLAGRLEFENEHAAAPIDQPGRPHQPELIPPQRVPRRRADTLPGRAALIHALAHIEFVAIDLALDMAGRFGSEMGEGFIGDFLAVAAEEAMHFALLDRHLRFMGSHYGALPAHDGLWSSAHATRHDVAARLAVVPMALEARGLDVTPQTIERVLKAGDERGALVLSRILDDEIRHVAVGTKHFFALAERRCEAANTLWKSLIKVHFAGSVHPPFNDSARLAAGLSREFYAAIAY
jgi:uncharacterized ferritin-like protein (DUF455 family)